MLEEYKIRICPESELSSLISFINNHWAKDHILSISEELLRWQHYSREDRSYNFVIAQPQYSSEIYGILGFIMPRHFDPRIKFCDLWLTTWKVTGNTGIPNLGLALLFFLLREKNPRSISSFGINFDAIPIYKSLGYKIGTVNHYYIVNQNMRSFDLIGNFDGEFYSNASSAKKTKKFLKYSGSDLKTFNSTSNNGLFSHQVPSKSISYLYERYINHPIYHYDIYAIYKNEDLQCFFVIRESCFKSAKALRIVDLVGRANGLDGTIDLFQNMLLDYDAEYIDFYNLGLSNKLLSSAGFIKRSKSSNVIIPNYFEQFEKRNVELIYAFKSDSKLPYSIFKGDCDQDRPNKL
tara:strand:- start:2475 stop:3524 length:1050 start_codon:yes stop_codon:yes gene_type:complete